MADMGVLAATVALVVTVGWATAAPLWVAALAAGYAVAVCFAGAR